MTKKEWDELQAQFLVDNARTGIKLKEWCEAREIEFNSARRYIKTKAAQSAQKKVRTAQKEKCAEDLVGRKLSPKVKRFIAEYLKDNNATAAERAGYSDPNYGRQILTLRRQLRSSRKLPLCPRWAVQMRCLSRFGAWPPSMPTRFLNIAVVHVVIAGLWSSVSMARYAAKLRIQRAYHPTNSNGGNANSQ